MPCCHAYVAATIVITSYHELFNIIRHHTYAEWILQYRQRHTSSPQQRSLLTYHRCDTAITLSYKCLASFADAILRGHDAPHTTPATPCYAFRCQPLMLPCCYADFRFHAAATRHTLPLRRRCFAGCWFRHFAPLRHTLIDAVARYFRRLRHYDILITSLPVSPTEGTMPEAMPPLRYCLRHWCHTPPPLRYADTYYYADMPLSYYADCCRHAALCRCRRWLRLIFASRWCCAHVIYAYAHSPSQPRHADIFAIFTSFSLLSYFSLLRCHAACHKCYYDDYFGRYAAADAAFLLPLHFRCHYYAFFSCLIFAMPPLPPFLHFHYALPLLREERLMLATFFTTFSFFYAITFDAAFHYWYLLSLMSLMPFFIDLPCRFSFRFDFSLFRH